MKHLVAPSVLACDFSDLYKAFEIVNNSEADWFHVDIMDGVFVPNISFGMPLLKSMKQLAKKPLDVHLMIVQPERYIEEFVTLGADILTVHAEACPHLHRNIQQIKSLGVKAGVALNPGTPISALDCVLEDIDLVCLMSVNPGFGGQKFIPKTLDKISALKQKIKTANLNTLIEIDGGVGIANAKEILDAGADVLVAGSSVYKADQPNEAILKLKSLRKYQ